MLRIEVISLYDFRKLIVVCKIFLWTLKLLYSLFIVLHHFFAPQVSCGALVLYYIRMKSCRAHSEFPRKKKSVMSFMLCVFSLSIGYNSQVASENNCWTKALCFHIQAFKLQFGKVLCGGSHWSKGDHFNISDFVTIFFFSWTESSHTKLTSREEKSNQSCASWFVYIRSMTKFIGLFPMLKNI